jgi:hypothetical protein
VPVAELKVGALLAEGGEGVVHLLPRQPHLLYKSYRRSADRSHLEELVSWAQSIPAGPAAVVRSASAWPHSVVSDDKDDAVGLLMPRAPRRFALRHRDGHSRLASLSYLTADPEHRAVAYGLRLPVPAGPERVGLAYALAGLLSAFESGHPQVGHGDLSTKNVLWSLQRGPEVFVLDCDNCDFFGPDGQPVRATGRRRAMTPNWDDPAVPRGSNPNWSTDRYSLGLIFLRVVGAANFPVQARQRGGDRVEVAFPVPAGPGSEVLLDPGAPVWRLCSAALSLAGADRRPPATAWLTVLERLLIDLGAPEVIETVRAAQGGAIEGAAGPADFGWPEDVVVVPEAAPQSDRRWQKVSPGMRFERIAPSAAPPAIGYRTVSGAVTPPAPPVASTRSEISDQMRRFLRWWIGVHRDLLRTSGGPARSRAVVICASVDFGVALAVGVAVATVLALLVSPLLGL